MAETGRSAEYRIAVGLGREGDENRTGSRVGFPGPDATHTDRDHSPSSRYLQDSERLFLKVTLPDAGVAEGGLWDVDQDEATVTGEVSGDILKDRGVPSRDLSEEVCQGVTVVCNRALEVQEIPPLAGQVVINSRQVHDGGRWCRRWGTRGRGCRGGGVGG